jgi:hypothetical protein
MIELNDNLLLTAHRVTRVSAARCVAKHIIQWIHSLSELSLSALTGPESDLH